MPVGERLAVTRDDAEILVQPDHDVSLGAAIGETLEPLERVSERLSAGYDRVNVQLSPSIGKHLHRVAFHEVAPERNEGGSTVVDDEGSLFVEQPVQQNIEATGINAAVAHQR